MLDTYYVNPPYNFAYEAISLVIAHKEETNCRMLKKGFFN